MKALEIDVSDIQERGIIAELPNNLTLELIYNTYDSFILTSEYYLCTCFFSACFGNSKR